MIKKIIPFLLLVLLLSLSLPSFANSDSPREGYIHIASGFFSHFNTRTGNYYQMGGYDIFSLEQLGEMLAGSIAPFQNLNTPYAIKFKVTNLRQEDQLVYACQGTTQVTFQNDLNKTFSLVRHNYIEIDDQLFYEIRLIDPQTNIYHSMVGKIFDPSGQLIYFGFIIEIGDNDLEIDQLSELKLTAAFKFYGRTNDIEVERELMRLEQITE